MKKEIKYYCYRRHEILIRGLCSDRAYIHTFNSDYGFKRLICEAPNLDHPGYELIFKGEKNNFDLGTSTPACLPCTIQLVEMAFNRTMLRHESRYNSRKGARKRLQYVRLL